MLKDSKKILLTARFKEVGRTSSEEFDIVLWQILKPGELHDFLVSAMLLTEYCSHKLRAATISWCAVKNHSNSNS